jgi:hypothetical protein
LVGNGTSIERGGVLGRSFDWFSSKCARAVRSPWFFIVFNLWTIVWFAGIGQLLGDRYPFIFWVTIVTYMTQADMILYGMWQKQLQQKQDEFSIYIQQTLKNQQDMMLFLVSEAKDMGDQLDEIQNEFDPVLPLVDNKLEVEKEGES